jgi:hypothetical protein
MTRTQIIAASVDTILTPGEVGLWLNMERREVARLGAPRFEFDGHPKSDRYLKGDVLEWLQQHRKAS